MKRYTKIGWYVVLLIISVIPLLNLFHAGLPVTHDGQDHVARIANFYHSLSEGVVIPRWAGLLNWGYGHPILMFLYPFPSYVASLFHFIGFSFVDSTKLVFALGFVASFFAMYVWAACVWGRTIGSLAAVLYVFAPYRFVDLYVRGAIGEHMAFVFPPLIFLGLYHMAKDKASSKISWALTVFGCAGLILSHNALSLMFLPIIGLYVVYLCAYETKHKFLFIAQAIVSIFWGFIVSAFFWIPALLEGKYTLRDIVTAGDFAQRFVSWDWFFRSFWNYGGGNEFSKYLGLSQLAGLVIMIVTVRGMKRPAQVLTIGAFVGLLAALYLMTNASLGVWQTVTLIQKFQFPWRLLSVAVFLLSVIASVGVHAIPSKLKKWCAGSLCVIAIISTVPMWRAHEYRTFKESYFTSVYKGTTDTGESSPIWSIRFMEHEPKAPIEVISGQASFVQTKKQSTIHTYKTNVSQDARVVENTLYFPGWVVRVDGAPVALQFQDPEYRGLMTFMVPRGDHTIDVRFGETNLRKMANAVSVLGIVLFIIFVGTMRIWQPKLRLFQSR